MNIIKNKNGLGLLEVIIAGGLLVGLALGVMQVSKLSNDVSGKGMSLLEWQSTISRIKMLVTKEQNCSKNLIGSKFDKTDINTSIALTSLERKNGTVIHKIGDLMTGQWKLSKFEVYKIEQASSLGQWNAELKIEMKDSKSGRIKGTDIPVIIAATTDPLNSDLMEIQKCSADPYHVGLGSTGAGSLPACPTGKVIVMTSTGVSCQIPAIPTSPPVPGASCTIPVGTTISAGGNHTNGTGNGLCGAQAAGCTEAYKSDGTVVACGFLGPWISAKCDTSFISAGGNHTNGTGNGLCGAQGAGCTEAYKSDGTVAACGFLGPWMSAKCELCTISVGGNHTNGTGNGLCGAQAAGCTEAYKSDGTVVACGFLGPWISAKCDSSFISAGGNHTNGTGNGLCGAQGAGCTEAYKSDGTVAACGFLGPWISAKCDTSFISAGGNHTNGTGNGLCGAQAAGCTEAYKSDGTVVACGFLGPWISAKCDTSFISAGGNHTNGTGNGLCGAQGAGCAEAYKSDGTVAACGFLGPWISAKCN